MTLIPYTQPRPYLLRRASQPGRPLIVYLPGYTQRVEAPDVVRWHDRLPWQWRKNAVVESGLLDLAERHDVNVCWVSASRYAWAPWFARNWSERDVGQVALIAMNLDAELRPSDRFLCGFSDGATLVHEWARERGRWWDGYVAHSGLWGDAPVSRGGSPLLLVCGDQEPHRAIRDAQPAIQQRYRDAGRTCELWELPGVGHTWDASKNDSFLDWCLSYS